MFDRRATTLIRPLVNAAAKRLAAIGLGASQITLAGFVIGLFASYLIATHDYLAGAIVILASRICDVLDGAVARLTQASDAGAYLDISLDFLFYASIPLAFAVADPLQNALPAAVLLAAFIGTATSFLAFATLAAKRGLTHLDRADKSFYFLGGLTEATETVACFVAMCLWPKYFPELGYGFALLCGMTIVSRLWLGWRALK
jgi:phosphatidylglycerophosphate synthase